MLWLALSAPLIASAHGGEAHLELDTTQAVPGTPIGLRGVGFEPESTIIIMLVGAERQLLLGSVSADEAGDFTQALPLPVDLLPGAYELRAADSHHSASIPLNVAPGAGSEEEGQQQGEDEPLLAPMPTQAIDTGYSGTAPTAKPITTSPTPQVEPPIPISLLLSSALAIIILVVGLFVFSRRSR